MSVYDVEVSVAHRRPPTIDARIWYRIEADNGNDAELIACQWAAMDPHTVMPVASVVINWEEGAA